MVAIDIQLKHEIPGQNKVIPGSLQDKLSKSVISLDCTCPGQPWTVGYYASAKHACIYCMRCPVHMHCTGFSVGGYLV